jgi:beta-phosphoglucomutase-like phosphatase (HAD superfamily)
MHPELSPGCAGCLIFDWDGTLVDSQSANYRAMAAALEREAVTLDQDWFDARTGLSSAEMIHKLVNERQVLLTRPVEEVVGERDALFLQQAHTVRPHPAILAVVEASKGRLPMAIASGGSRHIIASTLTFQPFHDAFRAVITREDVERGKPAPDIFLAAARALEFHPERCLVYEDSDEGIAAAHAARMRVTDVRPFTR